MKRFSLFPGIGIPKRKHIAAYCLSIALTLFVALLLGRETMVDGFMPDQGRLAYGVNRLELPTSALHFSQTEVVSGFDKLTRFKPYPAEWVVIGSERCNVPVVFADTLFLRITHYPVKHKNLQALDQPGSALVSKKLARKAFGRSNPVGRELTGPDGQTYTITGEIHRGLLKTSSLRCDVIMVPRGQKIAQALALGLIRDNVRQAGGEAAFQQYLPARELYFRRDIRKMPASIRHGSRTAVRLLRILLVFFIIASAGWYHVIHASSGNMMQRRASSRFFFAVSLFGSGVFAVFLCWLLYAQIHSIGHSVPSNTVAFQFNVSPEDYHNLSQLDMLRTAMQSSDKLEQALSDDEHILQWTYGTFPERLNTALNFRCGGTSAVDMCANTVPAGYFDFLGIPFLHGRTWANNSKEEEMVINETAWQMLGLTTWDENLHIVWMRPASMSDVIYRVCGVVRDFKTGPLERQLPMVFRKERYNSSLQIMAKLTSSEDAVCDAVATHLRHAVPDVPTVFPYIKHGAYTDWTFRWLWISCLFGLILSVCLGTILYDRLYRTR
ncbi:MAG: ABC transporter permease [Bacteroidales bacterium]|nr:ABC transporter permease [Bacteroidales bacterium]MCR5715166.1 ABC transporter permease [Bacteroidales bacterium]